VDFATGAGFEGVLVGLFPRGSGIIAQHGSRRKQDAR